MNESWDKVTGILTTWWRNLENNKGIRAELRRCDSAEAVIYHPAFVRLSQKLQPLLGAQDNWQYPLAAVVGLLSHVRQPSNQSLARAMAGNPPVVSELRFRRLLQRDRSDLYGAMIRVLRMLDDAANLADLMTSVFFWGDRVRRRWAQDYFPNTPEKQSA
jgi:CRISPR system Cascade subunit CasB